MMPSQQSISSRTLAYTVKGIDWLAQFANADKEIAREMLAALTLVSHSAFERALNKLIRDVAGDIKGPVALFAVREIDPKETRSFFEIANHSESELNAVGDGSDLGSEARIAALIRDICKSDKAKFLNHPTISQMRQKKCRAIIVVDDLIGSGRRTEAFLDSLWRNRTIRAWKSRKYLQFHSVAYSATLSGLKVLKHSKCAPLVKTERDCPTIHTIPWPDNKKDQLTTISRYYGKQTSRPSMSLGFENTFAMMVFEHGCPNNLPSILWAPKEGKSSWDPLFPNRSVLPDEKSVFPIEITRRDSITTLVEIGMAHIKAKSLLNKANNPLSENELIVLALFSKRITTLASIGFALGLSNQESGNLIEDCISRGLLTPSLRLTDLGKMELKLLKKGKGTYGQVAEFVEEPYYPKSLRGHIGS